MVSLLRMFVDKGSDAVVAHVDDTVPEAYLKVLQTMTGQSVRGTVD